jgi:hypothetical protein
VMDLSEHPRVVAAKRRKEPEIEWEFVPRLEPGVYRAYSRSARTYHDRVFKRWVCAVQFDILGADLMSILGRLTLFLNLGSEDRPHATRRKKYWTAWEFANGGPPQRSDRMSPRVFTKRYALVRVADTTKDARQQPVAGGHAYSVVTEVLEWETGVADSQPSALVDKASGQPPVTESSPTLHDVDANANSASSGSSGRPLPGSGKTNSTHPKGGRAAKATRPSKAPVGAKVVSGVSKRVEMTATRTRSSGFANRNTNAND